VVKETRRGTRDLALLRPDDLNRPLARRQLPLSVAADALALALGALVGNVTVDTV